MSALKLGFLAIRTIAKPIANSIKSYSVKHPNVAQFSHKTEMQLKMKFLGYKVESIRPLNDARAVEMGANFLGEAIIFGVAGSLIILENAREEFKQLSISSEQRIDELQKENMALKKTLNEILDVSLRLRNHTPYSGQEIAIGNTSGGFVLQIADEPMVRSFPPDSSPTSTQSHYPSASSSKQGHPATSRQSSTSTSSSEASLQSSYDFHHEHHQLGHPQPEDDFILIDQPTSTSPQHVKKTRWEGISLPWSSSGPSGTSSSPPSAA
ncbi:hypothetical protein BGX28_002034 [Mortierella sp. GBA30]|nr:hypothetical protein BGX28_002034 [Mortierella sp. GBA30]